MDMLILFNLLLLIYIHHLQITKLVGSGSSFQKFDPALRVCTESVFGLPLLIQEGVDAPKGAAMAVRTISNCDPNIVGSPQSN